MKYLVRWIFFVLTLASSFSFAAIEHMVIKARYRSREGKAAVVTYRGKDLKIPTSRIHHFSKAVTGKDVLVTVYPQEIGLGL